MAHAIALFCYFNSLFRQNADDVTKAIGAVDLCRYPDCFLMLLTYKSSVNLFKSGFTATIFPSRLIR